MKQTFTFTLLLMNDANFHFHSSILSAHNLAPAEGSMLQFFNKPFIQLGMFNTIAMEQVLVPRKVLYDGLTWRNVL